MGCCSVKIDGVYTGIFELIQHDGIGSTPAVSPIGTGRIYFDPVEGKYMVSEDGGAWEPLVGIDQISADARYVKLDQTTPQTITNDDMSGQSVKLMDGTYAINATGDAIVSGNVDTETLTINKAAQTGVRERLMTAKVSDDATTNFFINNGTITDGVFAPVFGGYTASTTLWPLGFSGYVGSANDASDSSSYGIVDFSVSRTTSPSDALNGTLSNIVNRKAFNFRNYLTNLVTIMADGDVGIGTSAPATKLHISDGNAVNASFLAAADLQVISKQSGAPGFMFAVASTSATDRGVFKAVKSRGTLASPTATAIGDNTFSLLGAAYDGAAFRATAGVTMIVDTTPVNNTSVGQAVIFETGTTARAEKMRIASSGNVGIGVTAPTQGKLVINAPSAGNNRNVVFEQSVAGAAQTNDIVWRSSTGSIFDYAIIRSTYGSSYVNSYWQVKVADSSMVLQDRLHINVSGNIGIGTVAPSVKLHVSDGTAINDTIATALSTSDFVLSKSNVAALASTLLATGSSATSRGVFYMIRARGTTDSPTIVQNNDNVGDLLFGAWDGSALQNNAGVFAYVDGTPSAGVVPMRISFVTSATNTAGRAERLIIKNDGKVGIGNSSPEALLHVEGSSFPVAQSTRLTTVTGGTVGNLTGGLASGYYLETTSSGNMTDGFGGGIVFGLKDTEYDPQALNSYQIRLYGYRDGADNQGALGIHLNSQAEAQFIIRASGNVGIGTTAPSARLHTVSTTEQLRVGYDVSNYFSTTVGSTGGVTFNASGSGALFDFREITRFGDGTNYTEFESDGTYKAVGTATTFDDLLGDITQVKTSGPGVSLDTTESSVDFTTASNLSDYIIINYQITHRWKVGSSIYPHLHFWQNSNAVPNFLIQYRWQSNGSAKTTAWTNYKCNTLAFSYTSGTINNIAYGAAITPPVGAMLSDVLQFRILRDNANTSGVFTGADTYAGNAEITSADIHLEMDTLGSRSEYAK